MNSEPAAERQGIFHSRPALALRGARSGTFPSSYSSSRSHAGERRDVPGGVRKHLDVRGKGVGRADGGGVHALAGGVRRPSEPDLPGRERCRKLREVGAPERSVYEDGERVFSRYSILRPCEFFRVARCPGPTARRRWLGHIYVLGAMRQRGLLPDWRTYNPEAR